MAKRLQFYDLKAKDYFTTSKYKIETRYPKGIKRRYAVAKSTLSKKEMWKVLPKNFKE